MTTSLITSKPWYESKTMWTNMAAIVTAVGTWVTTGDLTLLGPAALGVINLILRSITKAPLE